MKKGRNNQQNITTKKIWFLSFPLLLFFNQHGCPDQLGHTSTNPTHPEVNNHVNL